MLYLYFLLLVQIFSSFPSATPGSCPPQPAEMTGCIRHRNAPWNLSSTSSPTRAPQHKKYKIWTKQPLFSKCHIEKKTTILSSFNRVIVTRTLLSIGNSCGQSGNKLLPANKPNPFTDLSQPESLPWMLLPSLSSQSIPKGAGLTCCSICCPWSPAAYASLLGSSYTHTLLPYASCPFYFHRELKPAAAPHLWTHTLKTLHSLSLSYGSKGQHPCSYLPLLPHSSGLKAAKSSFF